MAEDIVNGVDFMKLGTNLRTISSIAARIIDQSTRETHDLVWAIQILADATAAEIDKLPGGWKCKTGEESRHPALS